MARHEVDRPAPLSYFLKCGWVIAKALGKADENEFRKTLTTLVAYLDRLESDSPL